MSLPFLVFMKYFSSFLVILTLVVLTGCGSSGPEDVTIAPNLIIRTQEVSYMPDASFLGYLAQPNDDEEHPAVILIHEWWGLNDNMRDYANRFAEQGYVALAIDLYEGEYGNDREEAGKLATSVRENLPKAFANLNAAVSYLRSLEGVSDQRLAAVGWCFGGGWSYEMAKNDLGVKASVMYYGRFSLEDDLDMMKAHILGHFGEEDAAIKIDDAKQFQAKLKTLSGEHEVFIYPNAGHGFANEISDNYREEDAKVAWERTLEFLSENL
jgi:carboxymethylenebutenolidase